jgi:hypothetical protein
LGDSNTAFTLRRSTVGRLRPVLWITGALALAFSAAQGATLSFDQLQVGEEILEYYNGGLGSNGTGPGPSFGVSFTSVWTVSPPDVYGAADGKSAAVSGTGIVNFHRMVGDFLVLLFGRVDYSSAV